MGDPSAGEGSDAAWIAALQRREAWAWERLHHEAVDPVFGYLSLRCSRREEAEDLTAEVFAAAVTSIDRFRGEARVVTWLVAIARRKLLDARRRQRRHPELLQCDMNGSGAEWAALEVLPDATGSPEALLERREDLAGIRRLVLQLPELQREALWLRCVDQLSLAEIARVLHRSENAVKGLLRRARQTVLERSGGCEDDAWRSGAREARTEAAHVEPST